MLSLRGKQVRIDSDATQVISLPGPAGRFATITAELTDAGREAEIRLYGRGAAGWARGEVSGTRAANTTELRNPRGAAHPGQLKKSPPACQQPDDHA